MLTISIAKLPALGLKVPEVKFVKRYIQLIQLKEVTKLLGGDNMVAPRTALSMGERQGDEEGLAESLDDQTLFILYRVLSHSDLSALIAALNNSEES